MHKGKGDADPALNRSQCPSLCGLTARLLLLQDKVHGISSVDSLCSESVNVCTNGSHPQLASVWLQIWSSKFLKSGSRQTIENFQRKSQGTWQKWPSGTAQQKKEILWVHFFKAQKSLIISIPFPFETAACLHLLSNCFPNHTATELWAPECSCSQILMNNSPPSLCQWKHVNILSIWFQ